MNDIEWDNMVFSDEADDLTIEDKKNTTKRKRKWREIEKIKEQKKFQKEMLSYDEYQY